MKKIAKIFVLLLCTFALFFAGCGEDKVCGKWKVDSFRIYIGADVYDYTLAESLEIDISQNLPDNATNQQKADKYIAEMGMMFKTAVYKINNNGKMYLEYNEENIVEYAWERQKDNDGSDVIKFIEIGGDILYSMYEFEDESVVYYTMSCDENVSAVIFLTK